MSAILLGKKVKNEIKKQGRSITWVSEQMGLSPSSLSQRISGNPEFRYSELEKLTIILGLGENYNWFE